VPLAGRYEPEQRRARSDRTVDGGLIVLIDDDLNVTEAMRILLEAAGHAVIAAADASEALPLIRAQPRAPDVILADYRLRAGETGIDAIRCLWDRLGYVTPGILLTGDTSPERLREAAATGFDLVHKPIPPDELLRLFSRFL
jgi:CheY-like chemotaxis protein